MRKLILAVVMLSISCTNTLCGCTPPPELVYIRGTVRNADGDPLSGKRVRAEVAGKECEGFVDAYSSRVSGPDGLVILSVFGPGSDSTCVRLFARDTLVGAVESSVGSPFLVRTKLFPFDTIDVPMVLAPTVR